MSDAEKLVCYVRSLPDFIFFTTIDGKYGHIGATVADAVLQANNNYARNVKPRIERILMVYSNFRTTTSVLDLIKEIGATEFLSWRGEDRADLFCRVLNLFAYEGIESEADFREWLLIESNLSILRSIRGIGPKTVDYFKILVGIPTNAVDRHLLNFLALAGLKPMHYKKAHAVINDAADILSVDRAYFDHSIWQFMSRRPRDMSKLCSSTP